MSSVLAAAGVDRQRRDVLGRWAPEGSDQYVRTYRQAVRTLLATFKVTARRTTAYDDLDEDDVLREGLKRLTAGGIVGQEDGEQQQVAIAESFKAVYGHFKMDMTVGGQWVDDAASMDPAAALPMELAVDIEEEVQAQEDHFIIAKTKHGLVCCLHLAEGCHYAKGRKFKDYEALPAGPPPACGWNAVCHLCWPKKGPIRAPAIPGAMQADAIAVGSDSESQAGTESSTSSGGSDD